MPLEDFKEKRVNERSIGKRECVFKTDFGASYKGHKNITKSGRHCSLWEDNSSDFTTSTRWIGEFEENYCRKIDMGLKTPPGCYIGDEFESCDIPECGNVVTIIIISCITWTAFQSDKCALFFFNGTIRYLFVNSLNNFRYKVCSICVNWNKQIYVSLNVLTS
ncbi:PLG [Mytilus edulis]|uniref:PLG n=1 Tax=Mytilus edulis TaxID=6550 RepID=A0A8S3TAX4_MYTED|nr:PLG [Mytilus edulis]